MELQPSHNAQLNQTKPSPTDSKQTRYTYINMCIYVHAYMTVEIFIQVPENFDRD